MCKIMTLSLRRAKSDDLSAILAMARAFHAEDGHALDAPGEAAIAVLIATPELGRLWLIEDNGDTIGYVALCFGFSIEYGGRDAFIDDLYIVPDARGRGLGGTAMQLVAQDARASGCLALHLEVMDENSGATRLYERHGFANRGSRLMSRRMEALT